MTLFARLSNSKHYCTSPNIFAAFNFYYGHACAGLLTFSHGSSSHGLASAGLTGFQDFLENKTHLLSSFLCLIINLLPLP